MDFSSINKQLIDQIHTKKALNAENATQAIVRQSGIEFFRSMAYDIEVETETDAKRCVEMVIQAHQLQRMIEESRKKITQPHYIFHRTVKFEADQLIKEIEEIELNLKRKMDAYYQKRKEVQQLLPFENSILSQEGTSYQKEAWKYRVMNSREVPYEYLKIDEDLIKKRIASGIRNIPGIEIYSEMETKFKAKR
jgi:hypothetical protein